MLDFTLDSVRNVPLAQSKSVIGDYVSDKINKSINAKRNGIPSKHRIDPKYNPNCHKNK